MKTRLTAIDIRALVMTLKRKIKTLRIANIYDISNKLYLFKLAAKGKKEFLLVEAGIRMHTTDFVRNKNSIPSGFTMKLRKHLRTKRVEDIRQVGIDRVVDITLGQDEKAYHILIEFYASGNLILTDYKYNIISLLRTHRYDEDTRCGVGEPYPFTFAANLNLDSIVSTKSGIETMLQEIEDKKEEEKDNQANKKQKKKKKRKGEGGIKDTLIRMVPYMTPLMADHCMSEVGIDPKDEFDIEDDEIIQKAIKAALLCKDMVQSLETMDIVPGYIIYEQIEETENPDDLLANEKKQKEEQKSEEKPTENAENGLEVTPMEEIKQKVEEEKKEMKQQNGDSDSDEAEPGIDPELLFKGKRVKEFVCFQLNQMKEELSLEFDWFDECVDLYFTQIDKQKEESKVQQKENEIYKKMNRIKNDQLKRIEGLQKEQDSSLAKAKLLQNNIAEVQAILEILSALLQSGLQWKEIWRMIKEEKRVGNPLANLIQGLDLEKERAILIFNLAEIYSSENVDDFVSELIDEVVMKVDLDLTLSAQANIQKYFEIKKKTQDKEVRTKDKAHDAIKQAEDQARRALLKTRNEQKLKDVRKPYWFEKYGWFISSENYLIISGKNAQQNEEVVKTYLDKHDIYVHSEMAGSASCIVKNPTQKEVGPLTITEVGTWAICQSKAWDHKIVTNAYWVWGDQVSKTAQTGEYLVTGSFMVRGKKNYINPPRLELGCTIMFKLADDSIANHLNERRNRTAVDQPGYENDNASKVHEIEDSQPEEKEESENDEPEEQEDDAPEGPEEAEEKEEEKTEQEPEPETNATKDPTETKETQEETKDEEEKIGDENDSEGEDETENGDNESQAPSDLKSEKTDSKKQKLNPQNLPRGKKNKLKKKQKKYADQDPEDRDAFMKLHGAKEMEINEKKSTKLQPDKFYKTEQEKPKQDSKKKQLTEEQKEQIELKKKQLQNKKDAKAKNQPKNHYESDAKMIKKPSTTAKDKAEIDDILKGEDIKIVSENVDVSVLDQLTGNPKPGDTLLFAVPM